MIVFAHLFTSDFAEPKVVAVWIPGMLFQVFAIRLEGNVGKPGTGGLMFLDSAERVFFWFNFSEKRSTPKEFIFCLDFQARIAKARAAASFRQHRPAL